MTKRKVENFLPEVLKSSTNLTKFFNATINHWFEPENSENFSGYIGRFPQYYDPKKDFYIVEPTSKRQFYQMEPAMVSISNEDVLQAVLTYPDFIDTLSLYNSPTKDENKLFSGEYYSWAPPIDIDKFINFSDYYWYPEGPQKITIEGTSSDIIDVETEILNQKSYVSPNGIELLNGMHIQFGSNVRVSEYSNGTWIVEGVGKKIKLIDINFFDTNLYPLEYESSNKEYITIQRGAKSLNPWSRTNHWYHKSIISANNTLILDSNRQAKRPIIEYDNDLELYNYGNLFSRTATVIDTTSVDVMSNIHGKPYGSIYISGVNILENMTILVTKDSNQNINNRLYNVSKIEKTPGVFVYSLSVNTDGLNNDGSLVPGEKFLILDGSEKGQEFYFNGLEIIQCQRKIKTNDQPLFELYDVSGNKLSDENIFYQTTFFGNPIFSYIISTSSESIKDDELNFNVEYKSFQNISEILFENFLETEKYYYQDANLKSVEIDGYYFYHKLEDDVYDNGWHLNENAT